MAKPDLPDDLFKWQQDIGDKIRRLESLSAAQVELEQRVNARMDASKHIIEIPISWSIKNIPAPVGAVDPYPGIFIPVRTGETATLIAVVMSITTAGTVTFNFVRNNINLSVGLTATSTLSSATFNTALARNDLLRFSVTATTAAVTNTNFALSAYIRITTSV